MSKTAANQWGMIRTGFLVFALLMLAIRTTVALADAPVTKPAGDQTAQQFLAELTSDKVAAMSVQQAMDVIDYNPDSEKEKADAELWAKSMISCSKMELAVRDKWGKDAEVAVTHAAGDDTPDDVAKADWAVDEHHAVAQFRNHDLTPAIMIKKNGQWKIDPAGYRDLYHMNLDEDLKSSQATVDAFDGLNADLAKKDAFPNADAFSQHVKDVMAKLDTSN